MVRVTRIDDRPVGLHDSSKIEYTTTTMEVKGSWSEEHGWQPETATDRIEQELVKLNHRVALMDCGVCILTWVATLAFVAAIIK